MDQIRRAIERAKAAGATVPNTPVGGPSISPAVASVRAESAASNNIAPPRLSTPVPHSGQMNEAEIDRGHIEAGRIVAHHASDPRSKSFDMLRTQVLQAMDHSHWQILGITSPTPGCGKTVTALNLALSIARQPERSVLLLDLDLHKPQLANTLGLRSKLGVVSVLEGRAKLADALTEAQVGSLRMLVLPAETRVIDTTELIASRAMGKMLQEIKHSFPSHTVIMDLPPLLASDDVIAVLPQIDAILLVAAVGISTISEVRECNKYLQASAVLRIVLNKASEPTAAGYYGSVS